VRRSVNILALLGIFQFFLLGCYKKDLDEFKTIDTKHEQQFAFPVFDNTISIKDSIPFKFFPFALIDTAEINLSLDKYLPGSFYKKKNLDYVEFKVITENSFPLSGALQLYFADSLGVIKDSLFSVSRTSIDAGNGNTFSKSTTFIYMDKDKYQKILDARKIYIVYSLSTNPSSFVPYTLKVYCGIKFGLLQN
jgi:hypothetical protein